jgi:4-amino-4-deoxy-L-arabinose transferase-like glycosyltransferase
MADITIYQPPPRTQPGRELAAALLRRPATWAVVVTLLAFGLRVVALAAVPPGWRDDELIETLVISRNILGGDLRFYYPDASGHEALYHALNALFLAWFGPSALGIRLLSAFLGTLAVPLTYALGRRLFGSTVGLTAAALLAVSFWGLMYSRVGIRHVTTPVLALAAFYWFWRGTTDDEPSSVVPFILSGLFLGLGFHSYFASRGAPLIPLAFLGYVALVAPGVLRRSRRGLLVMAGVAGLVALPLYLAIAAQPAAEARVGELALPLTEARAGDFDRLLDHAVAALTMPHAAGDPEWLYNVPGRPLFGPVGAVAFWLGVALATWWMLRPLIRRKGSSADWADSADFKKTTRRASESAKSAQSADHLSLASAFVLIWWLVGISPSVLSVPPASLGHAILAQPAFFILAALPAGALARWRRVPSRWRAPAAGLLAALLVGATAARDLPAYFGEWPARGMVRYLYRADVRDVADFVLRDPAAPWPADFGITGLLAGPWDRVALELALDGRDDVRPRWFDPRRALLLWPDVSFAGYPGLESPYAAAFEPLPQDGLLAGDYTLGRVAPPVTPTLDGQVWLNEAPVCFANGLCWTAAAYDAAGGRLEVQWHVEGALDLPPLPLISNPPPPGVYSGPRLYVFAQLVDADGAFLVGDDGLWVDPLTLRGGDAFLQRHALPAPDGAEAAAVLFGLYDPLTGERILTVFGDDHVRLELE